MSAKGFELGLNTFGEVATEGDHVLRDAETVRLIVEEAQLAESVGLDLFSVGEHYREGFTDSATPVLLAAIATATERTRLGTSVTVLSTNVPVRLYHEFSTLDAVSNGRAQLILGRASATESSGSSATTWPTTSSCSRSSSTCSCGCSSRTRSPGQAPSAAPSSSNACTTLRRPRGPLPPRARTVRARPEADRTALTRPRRRHRRGGRGDLVALLAAGGGATVPRTQLLRADP